MNLFKLSGKTLVLILLLGILVLLLFLVSIYNSTSTNKTPLSSASPIPRLNPNDFPSPLPVSEGTLNTSPKKSVYRDVDLEKDFQRIKNIKPLSGSDSEAKSSLLSSLNNQSGYLIQNPTYKIEYVKGPNLFMIELLSTNTDSAQTAAYEWLKSRGLSDQGICNLPVLLYLNYDIAESLEQQNTTFNPIPKLCQ